MDGAKLEEPIPDGYEATTLMLGCPSLWTILIQKKNLSGTSLVVQWVRLRAPNAGGPGSIPGRGTRSRMHATTKSLHATTKDPMCRN